MQLREAWKIDCQSTRKICHYPRKLGKTKINNNNKFPVEGTFQWKGQYENAALDTG